MEIHFQRMMHSSIQLSCSCEHLGYLIHGQEIDKQYCYVHKMKMQSFVLGHIFTF